MTTAVEVRTTRVSFHGRVADELTRQSLSARRFSAALTGHRQRALLKDDGHFVFVNLPASPPPYEIELSGREFQSRTLTASLPAAPPLEVQAPGEDELPVLIAAVDVAQSRVTFSAVTFLPVIRAGATVLGPGAFSTTLAQDLEGSSADEAILQSVAGLAPGDPLRIVRSARLMLRPGPAYPYPAGTTIAAFRVGEATADNPPLPDALLQITTVDAAPLSTVSAGGLTLFTANLGVPLMLGPTAARETRTNSRGEGVFYFPGNTPITSLTVSVALAGYVAQNVTLPIEAQQRRFLSVQLVRS
jgi:hypothetical protein